MARKRKVRKRVFLSLSQLLAKKEDSWEEAADLCLPPDEVRLTGNKQVSTCYLEEKNIACEWQQVVWERASDPKMCRDVQQDFKEAQTDQERVFMYDQLKTHVWDCVKCPYANHMLQLCISFLPAPRSQFVIDEISACNLGFIKASNHRYGCRIIERLIENGSHEQIHYICSELVEHAETLGRHAFGNYVFQTIIEASRPENPLLQFYRVDFMNILIHSLSIRQPKGKHIGPVLEMIWTFADEEQRRKLRIFAPCMDEAGKVCYWRPREKYRKSNIDGAAWRISHDDRGRQRAGRLAQRHH